jgi:hypothetical protein
VPIHRSRIVGSVILVVILVIIGASTKAQTSQANTRVILNLLNGQQYFGAPHIYQGDKNGAPTSQWPVYYGPSTLLPHALVGRGQGAGVLRTINGKPVLEVEYYKPTRA